MKTVQDMDGNIIEVMDSTPCHAGIDGSLPTLYTKEEFIVISTQQDIDKAAQDIKAPRRNVIAEIARLEGQVTQRRIREAIAGTDSGWLVAQEALLAIERAKL